MSKKKIILFFTTSYSSIFFFFLRRFDLSVTYVFVYIESIYLLKHRTISFRNPSHIYFVLFICTILNKTTEEKNEHENDGKREWLGGKWAPVWSRASAHFFIVLK